MKLPENIRNKLKTPLGILIPENKANKEEIQKHIPKDSYFITVGDRTTEKLITFGLIPSVQIIDGQEKREERNKISDSNVVTYLTCDNPAAEITPDSIRTIKQAFSSNIPVRILVNGEEDLLVIPVCIHAPENALVLYGQPNEGLVIITVTPEIKNKTQKLLDLME